jgi:uncharacterized membrane protein YvbJ
MGSVKEYTCPNCGASINRQAKACPECGSDDQTGWSTNTYLDGIDIPDSDDYNEIMEREFGDKEHHPKNSWKTITAILLLLATLFVVLRTVC